ncbi:hypothetical protein [Streptomyces sp. NBC_01408]|uniref:hypothetical protein n=1 Tax=Streptomyces sp. NBC_01408 TaxID=2903855 RepID=UPI0022543126|nr:hypothetical protein [Streptomyces sp. NBC_01408]MCX4695349.1 hypothetical protein [Streptomyces sp. NBC_01408]
MPRVSVEGSEVVVRLSFRERMAVRRSGFRVPVAALRQVGVESSWWRVLRGAPGRGSWHPGRCVGFRRLPEGGADFVAVRADRPALLLELDPGAPLRRLALSVADAEGTRRALLAVMPAAKAAGDPGSGPPEPREVDPPAVHRPALQHEGGVADDHGRRPGTPSRTGTGSAEPPADPERVRAAGEGGVKRAGHGVRPPAEP